MLGLMNAVCVTEYTVRDRIPAWCSEKMTIPYSSVSMF